MATIGKLTMEVSVNTEKALEALKILSEKAKQLDISEEQFEEVVKENTTYEIIDKE